MKYGILKFSSYKVNVGDYLQLEGIRQAYKRMGIPETDIIEVERDLLAEYDGEYVVLPMAGAYNRCNGFPEFKLSKKILPVFIGVFTGDEAIAEGMAKYRNLCQDYGCRDLVTLQLLRQQGLNAYMSGCFSIGYERRTTEPENGHVYFCDVPSELRTQVPTDIMENSIELPTAYREMGTKGYSDDNAKVAKRYIEELIDTLKKDAKLVVTCRLHLALPCISMGIPVVLAHTCDNGDVEECRFSGLDRIIHVYKPSEYGRIDWNPKAPDIENLKERVINLAVEKISETYKRYENQYSISEFYEGTEPQIYYDGMKMGYLSENQKRTWMLNAWKLERTLFEYVTDTNFEDMTLVFYGMGDKGMWALKRYRDYIKRARKVLFVDGSPSKIGSEVNKVFTENSWDLNLVPGCYKVDSPSVLTEISKTEKKNLVTIVCAEHYYRGAGASIGNLLIKEYGLREGENLFFLDKLNNTLEMNLSITSTPFYWANGF